MSFQAVVGHARVIQALKRALRQDRLGHAYLFHGPAGVGKHTVARALAGAALCQKRDDDGCGGCSTCRRVASGVHPDLRVFAPAEGKRSIDIGTIRELRRLAAFRPLEAAMKVFILSGVEALTEDAANAFLKVLEEPPARTVLILIAGGTGGLLDTVVSRCQLLRFAPLTTGEVEQLLIERDGVDPEAARTAARLARGSYRRARDLQADELAGRQQELIQALFPRQGSGFDGAAAFLERVAEDGLKGDQLRAALIEALQVVLAFLRDGRAQQVVSLGGDGLAPLYQGDPKRSQGLARHCSTEGIEVAVGEVLRAVELIDQNVAPEAVLERMAVRVHQVLKRGPTPGREWMQPWTVASQ